MAPNRKARKPAPPGRGAGRGVSAVALPRARSSRARRVPAGLRATLNAYASKTLRSARSAEVRVTGSFPRVLRLPRLRRVAAGNWPCRKAQRLVPVTWSNDQWTPLVRVRHMGARRLPRRRLPVISTYPQSLTTI